MHKTAVRADEFSQMRQERDDVMLGDGFDFVDARNVELGGITIEVCRDPDDNRVLETAVLGAADWIVSGDKDLLTLGRVGSVTILTPSDWLAWRHSSP